MKLAVQPMLDFSIKEFLEVLESMVIYRCNLAEHQKSIFNIAFNEVIKNGRTAKLDGIEMKSIEDALNFRAIKMHEKGKIQQFIHYRILAAKIRTKLECFQNLYGPIVIKKTVCSHKQTVQ